MLLPDAYSYHISHPIIPFPACSCLKNLERELLLPRVLIFEGFVSPLLAVLFTSLMASPRSLETSILGLLRFIIPYI